MHYITRKLTPLLYFTLASISRLYSIVRYYILSLSIELKYSILVYRRSFLASYSSKLATKPYFNYSISLPLSKR